jgi:hypothetical protein
VRISRQTPAEGAATAREVEPRKTPVTRAQIRDAIARALETALGKRPSAGLVDVMTAHACLETGSGASMYNFNFGGIKGRGPDGATARCRTREVLGGREVEVRDGFRAYASLDAGALDYVRTMRARFGGAVAVAERGDAAAFAAALKKAGYYTASEHDYARGLAALMGSGATTSHAADGPPRAPTSALSSATRAATANVRDLFDAERFASALAAPRHARRVEEDDEG